MYRSFSVKRNKMVMSGVWLPGFAACLLLGALAGAFPALRASRTAIAETFRAV